MRVLLVEDDTSTAQAIELMLKSEGFIVRLPRISAKTGSRSASSTITTSSFSI